MMREDQSPAGWYRVMAARWFMHRLVLLSAQRRVQEREDAFAGEVSFRFAVRAIEALEALGARCENGRFIEPLRHHRHPRGQNRDFLVGREA